jgi:hypothetical protein
MTEFPADLVYFLHIPKTAGMSLHEFLVKVGGPDRVPPHMIWDDLLRGTAPITDRTWIVSAHFGGLFPLWLRRWPRIITILREPVSRALSHINHIQRAPGHLLHEASVGLSVEEYCAHPLLRRTVENFQARYLASLRFSEVLLPKGPLDALPQGAISIGFEDALYSLDTTDGLLDTAVRSFELIEAVGLCEAFGASLRLYAKVLGWDGEVEEHRVNRAATGQKTVADLTPGERETLTRLNWIDIQVYKAAREVFRRQCDQHGVAIDDPLRSVA